MHETVEWNTHDARNQAVDLFSGRVTRRKSDSWCAFMTYVFNICFSEENCEGTIKTEQLDKYNNNNNKVPRAFHERAERIRFHNISCVEHGLSKIVSKFLCLIYERDDKTNWDGLSSSCRYRIPEQCSKFCGRYSNWIVEKKGSSDAGRRGKYWGFFLDAFILSMKQTHCYFIRWKVWHSEENCATWTMHAAQRTEHHNLLTPCNSNSERWCATVHVNYPRPTLFNRVYCCVYTDVG